MKQTIVQLTLRRWEEFFSDPRLYALFFMFVVGFMVLSPLGFIGEKTLYQRFSFSVIGNSVCWPVGLLITPPIRIYLEHLGWRRGTALMMSCTISGTIVALLLMWVLKNEVSTTLGPTRIVELLIFFVFLLFFTSYCLMRPKYFRSPFEKVKENASDADLKIEENADPKSDSGPECLGVQERIPAHKRGVMRAMVAQDHYVEVITDKGSELILMRLSDAIAMCNTENCIRIHRSAWLSIDGVKDLKKQGRKMLVVMPCGRELPVARSAENELKRFVNARAPAQLLPA